MARDRVHVSREENDFCKCSHHQEEPLFLPRVSIHILQCRHNPPPPPPPHHHPPTSPAPSLKDKEKQVIWCVCCQQSNLMEEEKEQKLFRLWLFIGGGSITEKHQPLNMIQRPGGEEAREPSCHFTLSSSSRPSRAALPALISFCSSVLVPLLSVRPSVLALFPSAICARAAPVHLPPLPPAALQRAHLPPSPSIARKERRVNFHDEVEKHFGAISNALCRHGNSGGEALPRQKRANGGVTATTGRVTDSPPRGVLTTDSFLRVVPAPADTSVTSQASREPLKLASHLHRSRLSAQTAGKGASVRSATVVLSNVARNGSSGSRGCVMGSGGRKGASVRGDARLLAQRLAPQLALGDNGPAQGSGLSLGDLLR